MAQPSPYTPGAVASWLPGREEQLADIGERLDFMTVFQKAIPRIRVDTAPRGYGKTSLLAEVHRRASAAGILTLRLVAGEDRLSAELARAVAEAAANWPTDKTSKLRRLLRRLEVTINVGLPGIAQLGATLKQDKEPPDEGDGSAFTYRDFHTLVTTTVATARDAGHTGVLIMVDELQDADPPGLRSLCYGWQRIGETPDQLPAGVLAAGLPDVRAVLRDSVSNSERLEIRTMGTLSELATAAALVNPARSLGVAWHQDALHEAVRYSDGFPYTVQLIGDQAWRAAGRPDTGSAITAAHVATACSQLAPDLLSQHQARWSRTTPAERRFLRAMAELGGDHPVDRAALANQLGTPTRSLSVVRDQLISGGIIEAVGRGSIQFTATGFADYVRDHSTTSDIAADGADDT